MLAAQLHTTNLATLAIGAVSLAVVALWPKSYATPTAPTGQAAQIRRLAAHLPGTEVGLVLAAANEQPLSRIRRSGFEALLGADHDVPTLDAAGQLLSAPHPHPQAESPH